MGMYIYLDNRESATLKITQPLHGKIKLNEKNIYFENDIINLKCDIDSGYYLSNYIFNGTVIYNSSITLKKGENTLEASIRKKENNSTYIPQNPTTYILSVEYYLNNNKIKTDTHIINENTYIEPNQYTYDKNNYRVVNYQPQFKFLMKENTTIRIDLERKEVGRIYTKVNKKIESTPWVYSGVVNKFNYDFTKEKPEIVEKYNLFKKVVYKEPDGGWGYTTIDLERTELKDEYKTIYEGQETKFEFKNLNVVKKDYFLNTLQVFYEQFKRMYSEEINITVFNYSNDNIFIKTINDNEIYQTISSDSEKTFKLNKNTQKPYLIKYIKNNKEEIIREN